MKARHVQWSAWTLSVFAVIAAVVAWGQSYQWQLDTVGSYQLFPLFGLLAFSLMWGHYVASAIRQYAKADPSILKHYFETTSTMVLAAILLHPGLLIWQLWRDGFGLPPGSPKLYVGAAAYWAVIAAVVAWTAFIAYEFRRFFGKKRWWPLVQYASDIAMVLIFAHALRLGGALHFGWYKAVWYFYGVTFVIALVYGHSRKFATQNIAEKK